MKESLTKQRISRALYALGAAVCVLILRGLWEIALDGVCLLLFLCLTLSARYGKLRSWLAPGLGSFIFPLALPLLFAFIHGLSTGRWVESSLFVMIVLIISGVAAVYFRDRSVVPKI
jgi:hypothetical protein